MSLLVQPAFRRAAACLPAHCPQSTGPSLRCSSHSDCSAAAHGEGGGGGGDGLGGPGGEVAKQHWPSPEYLGSESEQPDATNLPLSSSPSLFEFCQLVCAWTVGDPLAFVPAARTWQYSCWWTVTVPLGAGALYVQLASCVPLPDELL